MREPYHEDVDYKLLTDKAVELDVVEEWEAEDDVADWRHWRLLHHHPLLGPPPVGCKHESHRLTTSICCQMSAHLYDYKNTNKFVLPYHSSFCRPGMMLTEMLSTCIHETGVLSTIYMQDPDLGISFPWGLKYKYKAKDSDTECPLIENNARKVWKKWWLKLRK